MFTPTPHLYGFVPALHCVTRLIPLANEVLALLVQLPKVLRSTVQLDLGSLQQDCMHRVLRGCYGGHSVCKYVG